VLTQSVSGLGMNWGTNSINPLPPNYVVKMLQANNITKVKLFDADYDVVRSLAGTDIEVMVAAPNDLLATLASSSDAADSWVEQNVTSFSGVNITYVFQSFPIASSQFLLDILRNKYSNLKTCQLILMHKEC
jgi:hypothetical protein